MLSKFGQVIRTIRNQNNELLYDMAQKLNVSCAELSAMEQGKSVPPLEWKESIPSMYALNEGQRIALNKSINEANNAAS